MSDEVKSVSESSAAPVTFIPATGVPPPDTPLVFADGVANLAHGKHVVKFYLYRSDPDAGGSGVPRNQVAAQIVMPLEGFIYSIAFLNKSFGLLVSKGLITQADLDKILKIVDGISSSEQ